MPNVKSFFSKRQSLMSVFIVTCALCTFSFCTEKSDKISMTLHLQSSEVVDSVTFALGESLFLNNCSVCHDRNMREVLTARNLSGVEERWSEYPVEDLYRFVRESQTMIQEGHPKAVEQWEAWKPNIMNNYNNLNDDEMVAIFYYIQEMSARKD